MPAPVGRWSQVLGHRQAHSHRHGHDLTLPDTATARYGNGTAVGIGVMHGVGVESPTQIAAFVASTTVVGAGAGMTLLLFWVVGLIVANSLLAAAAGLGLLRAERYFALYAGLAVIVAVASIVVGTGFIVGFDALPAI